MPSKKTSSRFGSIKPNPKRPRSPSPPAEMSLGEFRRLHAEERIEIVRQLQAAHPTLRDADARGIADRSLYHKYAYGGHEVPYNTELHARLRVEQYARDQRLKDSVNRLRQADPTKPRWACQMIAQAHDQEGDDGAAAVEAEVDAEGSD